MRSVGQFVAAQVEAAGRVGEVVMFPKLDKGGRIDSAVFGRFQAKQQPSEAVGESCTAEEDLQQEAAERWSDDTT